jgi:imidazolonepropionase-like amidohydrolase
MRYVLAAVLLWPACLRTADPPGVPGEIGPSSPVAFVNVNVVPMDAEVVLERHTLVVRDGRIAELGPAESLEPPPEAERIECPGCYLMPALADLHTHLVYGRNWENDLFLFLANGVTTVRDMWGNTAFLQWREAVASGAVVGPRLYVASPGMDGPTGRFAAYTPPITSPAQAHQAVALYKRTGYDFIKVYSDLTPEVYAAIVEEAKVQDIKVVGHSPTRVGLINVLAAGQYSIEHFHSIAELASSTGSLMTGELDETRLKELAELIRNAGSWYTPTMAVGTVSRDQIPGLERRPEMRYVSAEMKRWFQDPTNVAPNRDLSRNEANEKVVLKALHDAGVMLLLGLDSGFRYVLPGYSIHDELRLRVEAGLTPYQVIRMGTVNPAEFLNRQEEMGTVALGKRADLILLQENPLADVANLSKRLGVMVGGRWFSEARLRERLEEIAQAYGN